MSTGAGTILFVLAATMASMAYALGWARGRIYGRDEMLPKVQSAYTNENYSTSGDDHHG